MKSDEKELRKDSPLSDYALQGDDLELVSGGETGENLIDNALYELPGQPL